MVRTSRSRRRGKARRETEVPAVPTFQAEGETKPEEPAAVEVTENAVDEAVRKMVEAAYT